MKLELSLPRTRFVVDETLEVSVRLHNDGPTPVSVPDPLRNDAWQPSYVLTGPAFPEGRRFSARSATSRDARATAAHASQGTALATIELPPGGTHEGEVPLSLWCPPGVPGAYTLVAELEPVAGAPWPAVRSEPLALELEALAARGASVGVDVRRGPPADLHVGFVHAADPPVLYDALVTEDRPDLGELERASLEPRRTLGAGQGVSAVLVPWCNVDRMTAMVSWRAWVHEAAAGPRLYADDSPLGQPGSLPLAAGTTVLPPVWQGPAEALDVLVLEPDRRRLGLACFTSPGPTAPLTGLVLTRSDARQPPTGALVWRSEAAPGPLAAARLVLGPAALGSPRHVIALCEQGDGVVVLHYVVEPAGRGTLTATISLPRTRTLPGSTVALRVTAAGHVRAWLLLGAHDPAWPVYLVRVELDASGRLLETVRRPRPVVTLGAPLLEAALELALPEDRAPEVLAWALRTDDRRVLWSRGDRAPRWYKAPRPSTLAVPLQLRPLAEATVLATLAPGRAPGLVTLEDG